MFRDLFCIACIIDTSPYTNRDCFGEKMITLYRWIHFPFPDLELLKKVNAFKLLLPFVPFVCRPLDAVTEPIKAEKSSHRCWHAEVRCVCVRCKY